MGEDSGGFNVQSTASPVAPAIAIAALVLVPLVILGAVLAAVRSAPPVTPASGRWVCTPTQWVWVPDEK